jgi:hypothetical protein
VAIEDTGSAPVALTLRRGELIDEPGLGGGLLSSRLRLTVVDVTRPTAPRTVYAGPLDSMPERPAGTLVVGETRTYEFTATLPEGGEPSFQNAVQGASTTIAYSWVPSEADREAPEISGGQQGEGNGGVRGEGALLDLTVPRIRGSVRRGRLTAWTDCTMPCRLRVRGRLRATSATTGARRVAKVRWTSKGATRPDPTVSASASPARSAPGCERTPDSSASAPVSASPPSASTASETWFARWSDGVGAAEFVSKND